MLIPPTVLEQDEISENHPDQGFNSSFAHVYNSAELIAYPSPGNSSPSLWIWPYESDILAAQQADMHAGEWISMAPDQMINLYNSNLRGLFRYWGQVYDVQITGMLPLPQGFPPIKSQYARIYAPTKVKISINDLDDKYCDFQGIDWSVLGATRQDTREMRKRTYKRYTNVLPQDSDQSSSSALQSLNISMRARAKEFHKTANYFRFRQMHRDYNPSHPHFQLRHTISASSRNSVFFAASGKIWCANPQLDTVDCVMDFRKPRSESNVRSIEGVSALTASDGVLVIGGYSGQYALKSLSSGIDSPPILGTLTPEERIVHDGMGYTNHVCTFLDRRSGLPQAVFANNDHYVRILDCYSNCFTRVHNYGWAVNCTATSPDGRLRVVVGDTCAPWIVDAEKGDQLVKLANHTDFGFACAWSPVGTWRQETRMV